MRGRILSAGGRPRDGGEDGEVEAGGLSAAALRRAFDLSFAEAPTAGAEPLESLLALRVGGAPYAIRLSEIAGVHADRTVVPVPTPMPDLLGVAGIRGAIVPVYDLGALLGHPRSTRPRWMLLAASPALVGLAFESLEAHVRMPRRSIEGASDVGGAGKGGGEIGRTRGAVEVGGLLRPLIHVGSILEGITRRPSLSIKPGEGSAR